MSRVPLSEDNVYQPIMDTSPLSGLADVSLAQHQSGRRPSAYAYHL
jgi:hypothetical protein